MLSTGSMFIRHLLVNKILLGYLFVFLLLLNTAFSGSSLAKGVVITQLKENKMDVGQSQKNKIIPASGFFMKSFKTEKATLKHNKNLSTFTMPVDVLSQHALDALPTHKVVGKFKNLKMMGEMPGNLSHFVADKGANNKAGNKTGNNAGNINNSSNQSKSMARKVPVKHLLVD